jgi:outer membrane protein OmpA-like peptidoglycan-associated protein
MGRNQDTSLDVEGFTQSLLPQLYRLRISDGRKAIVKNDFVEVHNFKPILITKLQQ